MDVLGSLAQGFQVALTPTNILFLFVGVVIGNAVGVLPGLGPVSGCVLVIPLTFKLDPTTALIMLSGIYYGAMYGGSITSVLLNVPGEASSVMTAIEGHVLARQGRAGAVLGMSAITSFIAGTLSVVGLMFFTVPMTNLALKLGPPEEFALILMAFTFVASLGGESVLKGLTMCAMGIVLATIGMEPMVALSRLHFGIEPLRSGITLVQAAVGIFAIPEVLFALEAPAKAAFKKTEVKLRNLIPNGEDFRVSVTAFPLGTVTGFVVGVLPGIGPTVASFLTYGIQRRVAIRKDLFGKGSMEAVAAVEGANNSASVGALLPLLTLGIPGSGVAAVIMGAMMIHGLRPGPLLLQNHPEVVWGLIASMYLGNVMLLILNIPLISIWISMLRIPLHVIMSTVLGLAVIGVYAEDNDAGGVFVMFAFGILGYILRKLDFPLAPIVLALVLTSPLESALHYSLSMSQGDWSILWTRPIAIGLLIAAAMSILLQVPAFTGLLKRTGRRMLRMA